MVSLNDVLLAYSNIPVDDPIAEIWGRGLQGGYEIIEYTGTLPITITADGSALIDYHIYGNTVQNGTPTPENPIMPEGVGERTENLLDYATVESTPYATATLISGGITISGRFFVQFRTVEFAVGRSYTLSWTAKIIEGTVLIMWRFQYSDNTYSQLITNGESLVAEKEVTALLLYVNLSTESGVAELTNIMLNLGSTALPYEPYGYKLPMLSNSTVTSIYLGESQTTRRIKKLVLTGEEGWRRTANEKCYSINLANGCPNDYLKQLTTTSICSHYQSQNNTASGSNEVDSGHFCFYIGGGFELYIGETTISSATDFKSYLAAQYAAGTPVTVWYVLAEPETGIVNEPLMKIGDYADTLSMEQADVSIPTITGTTVIDYDGTPKPLRMYIKYRR